MGEEGVEVALAAVAQDDEALLGEAADLLYHLLVVLTLCGLRPEEVLGVLQQRAHSTEHTARSEPTPPSEF